MEVRFVNVSMKFEAQFETKMLCRENFFKFLR